MERPSPMKPLKILILGIACASLGVTPPPARAQWAVIDVASIQQQLIAYLEQVNQYVMQAQQLEQAVLQYENMVKNTLDLPAAVWANVGATLNGLNTIIANGQSIANQSKNLNLAFTTMFPTYQTMRGTAITNTTYQTQYQTWSNNTRSSLQTSITTAAQLLNAKTTDQSTVSSLQSQAQGATGNLQAVKAAAAVASQEVLELQQLKLLLAQNVATQGQYIADLESKRAMNEAATEQALSGGTPAYGSGKTY
jgi:type IV secretion system protein TrbJ